MLSKIAGIGLVAALALALVGGSAYILLRPTEAQAERGSGGRSREAAETRLSGNGPGNGGEAGRGRGTGGGGESAKGPRSDGGDHLVGTWLTVDGTVVVLEGDELTIKTADSELKVHLCPEWYWETQGITLNAGDEVAISGFYEGDDFEVGHVENLTTGESVTLRDESGRPMWAGRGRWGR
jgi:hypothetical protein